MINLTHFCCHKSFNSPQNYSTWFLCRIIIELWRNVSAYSYLLIWICNLCNQFEIKLSQKWSYRKKAQIMLIRQQPLKCELFCLISIIDDSINELMQERCNSIANALESHLSCTNPSIWSSLLPGYIHSFKEIENTQNRNTKCLVCCSYHLLIEGILPKGPYLPCLRMADRALLAGYPRYEVRH